MKKIILFALVLLFAGQIQAQTTQKVGHFNLGNFLVSLPEVADVDSLLQIYQQTLLDTIEQMDTKLKADVEAYQQNRGNMTAVQAQEKEQSFYAADQAVQKYAKQADYMLSNKRQVLLTPILEKLDKIIKEIGKEENYSIIMDASMMNALLFAKETEDVSHMVKAKYDKL